MDMQSELLDAVLTALNDVALDHQIGDEEMIHLVAANLGRLIVHTAEGDTVRFQELIKGATESISAGLSLSIEILDQD
jgi:hypothetical protein